MDEDDDGDKGINLHTLFNLQPNDMPYHIDVSTIYSSTHFIYQY